MKIAFFGTSDRSIPILESLKSNFELCLCVTKKDTKIGRHQVSKETGVKSWAKSNSVPYVEIDSLKNHNLELVLNKLREIKAEYGIVVDFSFIIPYGLINYFDKKLINIHFSLLPKYRGASPVQFAILNGDKTTGITFHLVDTGMDTGAVIKQIEYNITNKTTSRELYDILFKFSVENLPKVLTDFAKGQLSLVLQDETKASYTHSPTHPTSTFIYKEDAQIDWSKSPENIEREVHAFNPWPIAWCQIGKLEDNHSIVPENLILRPNVNKNLTVKIYLTELKNNKLSIKEIQVEGKNKMSFEDFLNGYATVATAAA